MSQKRKKSDLILIIGAAMLTTSAIFSILILTGVLSPNIFPPTGEILDVNPLASAFFCFLLLVVIIYVGTRILDFGLKYREREMNN